jgi:serine protease
VSRPGAPLSVREAWELTYRLRADRDVLFGGGDLPGARDDYQWSLKQVHAMAAWALPPDPGGATRGAGVKVGHPDTGYTHHPDIWPAAPTPQPILVAEGHNFIDGEDANDPTDALDDGFLKNPGHGTGTSSVIVGVPGAGLPPAPPWATGVAPDARIVPLRTSTSVVLWSMENLIKAIHYAVDHGCHLISISMGGLGGDALHESVRYAVGQDVIVLAAAGNDVGFVVWPAAYDEVLAVAATNVLRQPWIGSSKGPAVDFSAPGESVWRATAKKNNGGPAYEVSMGDGTSFAVATAAGICALWLAHHGGREALREKYGQGNVAAVFKELVLQHGCETDEGWDSDNYGVGIIGAVKVLQAAMPLSAPARGMRAARSTLISDDVGGVETFVHLFPELSRGEVRAALARTLRVTDNQLAGALRSTGHELAFHLAAHDGLRAAFTTAARPSNGDHARAFAAGAPLDPYESIRQRLSNHGASRRLLGGGLP